MKNDKRKLLEKLYDMTEKKEQELKLYSKDAQERANEAEGAMISRYDTFKEEGQYLAGGLKIRHEELWSSLAIIKTLMNDNNFKEHEIINILSIINIEFEDGTESKFFLLPVMGGEKIEDCTVITPNSPIAKSIIGKKEGDEFKYFVNNKIRKGEITFVI
ncbi:MAG: GreA/GreB family elongation factor [Desulfobacterales bacterium]|nr:GreA/GreB family elongation factor [Desulfobacterales bacterium]